MPFPLIPVIAAGASILGNLMGNSSNNRQNAKSQAFSREMYTRQRQDSLADFTMQNDYNSPTSQMARLKAAGLNPKLIYGSGDATSSAAPIRSSQAPAAQFQSFTPQTAGISNSLMDIYDIKMKQAQIDNLKTANTVATQDALLKAAQTASTIMSTSKTEQDTAQGQFNLKLAQDLRSTSVEKATQEVAKMKADTDYSLGQNERAAATTAQSLQKGAEEILSLRLSRSKTDAERKLIMAQIDTVRKDQRLKDLDIELKQLGIQPGDALWQRVLGRIIGDPNKLRLGQTTIPESWKDDRKYKSWDSLKIPYKSGFQQYLENRK